MFGFGLYDVSCIFYNLMYLMIDFIDIVERYIQKIDARFRLFLCFDRVTRRCISINGVKTRYHHCLAGILIFLLCAYLRRHLIVLIYTNYVYVMLVSITKTYGQKN
jgi:hypothetical protein